MAMVEDEGESPQTHLPCPCKAPQCSVISSRNEGLTASVYRSGGTAAGGDEQHSGGGRGACYGEGVHGAKAAQWTSGQSAALAWKGSERSPHWHQFKTWEMAVPICSVWAAQLLPDISGQY